MERLTQSALNSVLCADLLARNGEPCENICRDCGDCYECPIMAAYERLSAYEDTGMEPEEISAREWAIKQVFYEHFAGLSTALEFLKDFEMKRATAGTMNKITELYADIFDISYDDAAKELHGGDDNDG